MPLWRIAFCTFRRCMSFHTACFRDDSGVRCGSGSNAAFVRCVGTYGPHRCQSTAGRDHHRSRLALASHIVIGLSPDNRHLYVAASRPGVSYGTPHTPCGIFMLASALISVLLIEKLSLSSRRGNRSAKSLLNWQWCRNFYQRKISPT